MRSIKASLLGALVAASIVVPAYASAPRAPYPNPTAPDFACKDSSYQDVVSKGITLGISPDSPYTYLDPSTKKPTGIDWDVNSAVLKYIGVSKVNYAIMPFDSLIPAMLSHRIDVIADNIHQTPARIKIISFTSPAWWYGPALIVQKGNPAKITSYKDLTRSGVTVGTITGSAADEYITHLGAKNTSFQDNTSEFLSVSQGRVTVVLEDDAKFGAYKVQNPSTNLVVLDLPPPPDLISTYGYSYARYGLRKGDCTLNFAYSRALAELRGNGVITDILKAHGLTGRNLYLPGI